MKPGDILTILRHMSVSSTEEFDDEPVVQIDSERFGS